MVDSENYENTDNGEFVMDKFDEMLKNKRRIELNMNEDPDFIAKTDEEKDEAFIEKLKNQTKTTDDKAKFQFKLDI